MPTQISSFAQLIEEIFEIPCSLFSFVDVCILSFFFNWLWLFDSSFGVIEEIVFCSFGFFYILLCTCGYCMTSKLNIKFTGLRNMDFVHCKICSSNNYLTVSQAMEIIQKPKWEEGGT